ncbi:hypothetical protein ACYF6T_11955 [Streptomyces sp. 7R007]
MHPLNQPRNRPVWPFVLAGAICALAAVGTWVSVVYGMSDPATTYVAGIRFDGSSVSVKVPLCPSDRVEAVEVYDSDSEKLLWRASGPKTAEAERGAVTLWKAADFRTSGPAVQPVSLPANLDVSVTFAGTEDGSGDVFDVRKARAAHVADGRYWTRDGLRTAAQIDAQFGCRHDTP